MDTKFSSCLIGTMDRLWFRQIILSPETLEPMQLYSESSTTTTSTSTDRDIPVPDEEEEQVKKRSRRASLSRSRSSSARKRQRVHHHHQCKPQRSMSCKDLELQEVKGFMDLGFIFTKEHLNPRMIRVVPGLLRLGFFGSKLMKTQVNVAAAAADHEVASKDDDIIRRPYLSEAWSTKRPNSPSSNLKLPKVSASADHMKKHLKFWAKSVASVVSANLKS